MKPPTDNGYISECLIHWTGRDSDKRGADTLSIIASSCELLLSYNRIHVFDWYHEIHEKMVCFTDVPLGHSNTHCRRYGRFGVAFHKLKLMNAGAQPVFYVSHAAKRDMDTIFRFLRQQSRSTTLAPDVFRALHRHFYFMQRLSEGRADGRDTYYYEREWRLGAQSLPTQQEPDRPNARYWCQQEGYGAYIGIRVIHGDKEHFSFDPSCVAFLIAPRSCQSCVANPHGFQLYAFEALVEGMDQDS
jgi:hypothetical protein